MVYNTENGANHKFHEKDSGLFTAVQIIWIWKWKQNVWQKPCHTWI